MEETHSTTVVHPQQNQPVQPQTTTTTNAAISTSELKSLYSKIQCVLCFRFPKNPIPLSCNHIFCQQCLNGLINVALTNAPGTSRVVSVSKQVSQAINEPKISCPVCSKKFTVNEVTDINPNSALSQVTKFFDEVSEDRPMCSSCSNQRWIIHGSEYVFCQTCNIVACPMCALDSHRSHQLKYNFNSAFRSYREFGRKSATVKEEWINKLKIIEEAKLKSQQAKYKILQSKNELIKLSEDLDARVAVVKQLSDKLTTLENPSYNERTDKLRMDTLRRFEKMVQEIKNSIEPNLTEINAKADAIIASEACMLKSVEPTKSEDEKGETESKSQSTGSGASSTTTQTEES